MAASDYFGVNQTKALNPTSDNVIPRGQYGGRVRVIRDYWTSVAVTGGAVEVEMGTLPAGATLLDINVNCEASLGDTSSTITIKKYDGTTATSLTAALDAAAGFANEQITVKSTRGKLTGEHTIRAVFSAHDILVGEILEWEIYYTTD